MVGASQPLALDSLLATADEDSIPAHAPARIDIGHINLHVANLAEAEEFFRDFLGLEVRSSPSSPARPVPVDPDKMVTERKAGTSPWELHERALTREFTPTKPYDPRPHF
jgi:hypothetical protein